MHLKWKGPVNKRQPSLQKKKKKKYIWTSFCGQEVISIIIHRPPQSKMSGNVHNISWETSQRGMKSCWASPQLYRAALSWSLRISGSGYPSHNHTDHICVRMIISCFCVFLRLDYVSLIRGDCLASDSVLAWFWILLRWLNAQKWRGRSWVWVDIHNDRLEGRVEEIYEEKAHRKLYIHVSSANLCKKNQVADKFVFSLLFFNHMFFNHLVP